MFRTFRRSSTILTWIAASSLILPQIGCEYGLHVVVPADDVLDPLVPSDQGGGGDYIFLPCRAGEFRVCTQGPFGTTSHSGRSTMYGIDLDTSNTVDEELYAPASGTIHLFSETDSGGFGIAITIDRGDGTYVVLGHLDSVFVHDGEQVVAGQLIGYEGCTGVCTGDHVHIGLMRGDASLKPSLGESIPTAYFTYDVETGSAFSVINDSDFVCGIAAEGDPQDGHGYAASLQVPAWHPNDSLVKTGNDPRVFLLDQNDRRWITTQDVFWNSGYDFRNVATISSYEMGCYGEGFDIDEAWAVDAVRDSQGQIWLLLGSEDLGPRIRRPVLDMAWDQVLATWGLQYSSTNLPPQVASGDSRLTDWIPQEENAKFRNGTILREQSNSDIYIVSSGVAVPVVDWNTYLFLGYGRREIVWIPDGAIASILFSQGSCLFGEWCIDMEVATSCGETLNLGHHQGNDVFGNHDDGPMDDDDVSDDDADDDDSPTDDDTTETDTEEPTPEEEPTPPTTPADPCAGEGACIADLDLDGVDETLLLSDSEWIAGASVSEPSYVWANVLGCFDGSLGAVDYIIPDLDVNDYYAIDFQGFANPCMSELTLIASLGSDGAPPTPWMSNWYWWQNAPFCSQGSTLCDLQDNGNTWEDWLLSVSWSPIVGLIPNGNGFTSNVQL